MEYAASNDAYMHYDGFRWQAGSFLISGVFVFWGLLIQQPLPPRVITTASLLITGLMSVWLLFAHHYRQIYMGKLHRLWEIEELIGARQHLRFRRQRGHPSYPVLGPKGHHLDMIVYAFTSLGSAALGASRNGFSWWFLLPVPVVMVVTGYVGRNESRHATALKGFSD